MVSRKTAYGSVKEKKFRPAKTGFKVKKSFDYESLKDAIVDGKLIDGIAPGAELIIARPNDKKIQVSLCEVKKIENEPSTKGGVFVTTWDLTLERYLNFSTSELMRPEARERYKWCVKLKTPAKPVEAKKEPVVEEAGYVVTLTGVTGPSENP